MPSSLPLRILYYTKLPVPSPVLDASNPVMGPLGSSGFLRTASASLMTAA